MDYISWPSTLFYCLLGIFVFYQKLHIKSFQGASQVFLLMLNTSAFLGMLTGLTFLIYYGWTVIWWAPIIIFFISLLATVVGVLLEKLIGAIWLSLSGFIGWPVCAVFMFYYIPG